ncbi:hypothetical protein SHKM778_23960 [Streptomyces sp. KM77-8]|uniref:Uncharacterized protein n=1 Tax=Streptomyces haneummycinicus TaxID=3074435 RepID=A0AAT9HEV5_9ACTN
MGGLHGELGGDRHAFTGAGGQVQPVGLLAAAAETLVIVRAQELAGGGGVRVAHRSHGVGGG